MRWPEKIRNAELWERAGQGPVAKQILRRKMMEMRMMGIIIIIIIFIFIFITIFIFIIIIIIIIFIIIINNNNIIFIITALYPVSRLEAPQTDPITHAYVNRTHSLTQST
nr:hypothetical protein BaRGS_006267 [Batillaria attramentaria]